MDIIKTKFGDTIILELSGKLDNSGSESFENFMNTLLLSEKGMNILLDFENVEYMSSSGLRVLMILAKKMEKSSGNFSVCKANKFILDVFTMSSFDKVISIKPSREEALNSFN